ncbi:MAG: isoprenylcysteine carboxylmethyltransferase family protein [Bacteroidia bacterium]
MQIELKLLYLALAWGLYYFTHSFLALDTCKAWGRSRLGQKKYRLLYNLWSSLTILPLLYVTLRMEGVALWTNAWPLQLLGCVLILGGLLLGYRALNGYDLGEFSGLGQNSEEELPLVVAGLNAYVRHPLYSAILLLVFGLGLLRPLDTLWVTIGMSVVYIFWGSALEERKLIKRYGEAYQSYRREVKRFIPYLL